MALDRPFTTDGTVHTFPETLPNHSLVIRVENITNAKVYLGFGSKQPTATSCDMYMLAGDAYEIDYATAKSVNLINDAAATPKVFWHHKKSQL